LEEYACDPCLPIRYLAYLPNESISEFSGSEILVKRFFHQLVYSTFRITSRRSAAVSRWKRFDDPDAAEAVASLPTNHLLCAEKGAIAHPPVLNDHVRPENAFKRGAGRNA
jgi:hypothetical protein